MKHFESLFAVSCALALFFTAMTQDLAEAKDYTVKRGDTYANIARKVYGEPVFGPKGTIEKIYRLNSKARKNSALEPGEIVVLEDSGPAKAARKTGPAVKRAPTPPAALPPSAHEPVTESFHDEVIEDSREKIHAPPAEHVPEQLPTPTPIVRCPEPVVCSATAPLVAQPATQPATEGNGYFSITPVYYLVTEKAIDTASGASYTVTSSQAYGVDLAWDHWWNQSFSTVLAYSFMQIFSNEKNGVTGASVYDGLMLSRGELTLFNRMMSGFRLGLGAAYGEHTFLEQFNGTFASPTLFRTAYINPFLAADFSAFEGKSFELGLLAKIGSLPAQVGQGHDLTSGTQFFGQLSLTQKFESWALLYAVNYCYQNQSRTTATETRDEWTLRIGALF